MAAGARGHGKTRVVARLRDRCELAAGRGLRRALRRSGLFQRAFYPGGPAPGSTRDDARPGRDGDCGIYLLRARQLADAWRRGDGRGFPPGDIEVMSTDSIAVCLMLPLAAAGGIALANNRPNLREAVSLVASAALVLALLGLEPAVLAGNRPTLDLIEVMPGLVIAFEVEPLGLLFALVAAFLSFASAVYSIGYMRGNGEAHQTRFYLCFALALAATVAIAFSANAFTLLLFYEALTFVTYPLVTHHGDAEARNGG